MQHVTLIRWCEECTSHLIILSHLCLRSCMSGLLYEQEKAKASCRSHESIFSVEITTAYRNERRTTQLQLHARMIECLQDQPVIEIQRGYGRVGMTFLHGLRFQDG
jgi:hypothetical protein